MKRTGRRSRYLGLLCVVAIAAGCPADDPQPAPPTPPPVEPGAPPAPDAAVPGDLVEEGRQVYAGPGICFTCHGQAGEGTPLGPDLTDGDWIWVDPASPDFQAEMVAIIRTGVTQPREYPAPMPPMGGASLTDQQLEAVAAYVISLN